MTKNCIISCQDGIVTLPKIPKNEEKVYKSQTTVGCRTYQYERRILSKPNPLNYRILLNDYLKKERPEINEEQFTNFLNSLGVAVLYDDRDENN